MLFSSLKAKTGDAFVISWDDNAILIDGGMPNTCGSILKKLVGKRLRAIFITHVDYDHIGGIIKLIRQFSIDFSECRFFMNNPELACHYNGTDVRYSHGDLLQEILESKGHKFLPATSSSAVLEISGLKITTLLPTTKVCSTLSNNWNASRIIKEEKAGYTYLDRQKNNEDIINRSSICLLLERNGKKVLLLGDSNPDDVCNSLLQLTSSQFDLVKLSHHGSKHNTNENLLDLLKCDNYVISTNGNKYSHPNSQTINRLSEKAVSEGKVYNVFLNYELEEKIRKQYKVEYKSEIQNLKFFHKQEIQF